MGKEEDVFAFQLHKLEHVQARPDEVWGDDRCVFLPEYKVKSVPTLQLYGRSSEGSSVCLHVRNIYPYFLVEVPDAKNPVAQI